MRTVTASAPGSLMVTGEHAVLHGRHALVCAVDRRVTVRAIVRTDGRIRVRSALGDAEGTVRNLDGLERLPFVRESLRRACGGMAGGADIQIESEILHTLGLGSSAAVTVATLAAARALAGERPSAEAVAREAREVIRGVQGRGSGADAAASAFGGLVLYRAEPWSAQAVGSRFPMLAVYSGSKRPTAEVIALVEERRARDPERFESVYDQMDAVSLAGAAAARAGDLAALGAALNRGQELMDAIGVVNEPLADIVGRLRAQPGVYGSKVSGSGLGDCAIAVGVAEWTDARYPALPVRMESRGLDVIVEAES